MQDAGKAFPLATDINAKIDLLRPVTSEETQLKSLCLMKLENS